MHVASTGDHLGPLPRLRRLVALSRRPRQPGSCETQALDSETNKGQHRPIDVLCFPL